MGRSNFPLSPTHSYSSNFALKAVATSLSRVRSNRCELTRSISVRILLARGIIAVLILKWRRQINGALVVLSGPTLPSKIFFNFFLFLRVFPVGVGGRDPRIPVGNGSILNKN